MLVDPLTYGKQLEAYRHWIMGSALEVLKARNASVPTTRISVDAFEMIEFETELAHVSIGLVTDARSLIVTLSINIIVYWKL
jgi:hypothetical protein